MKQLSLKLTWAIAITFTLLMFTSCTQSSKTAKKTETTKIKNVILIIGDDHAPGVLGCYGNDIVRTPNLDKLSSEGIQFTRAYSNAPVCSASRQSLLTGKYPHASGVTLLRTAFADEGNITFAEQLRSKGYKTGVVGKTHFNNNEDNPPNHGFDYFYTEEKEKEYKNNNPYTPIPDSIKVLPKWKPFEDNARIWLNSEVLPSGYYDDEAPGTHIANMAKQFIQNNKDEQFCLLVGFHEPHSPFHFPIEYMGKYKPEDMLLPQGTSEDDRWIPEVFKDLTDDEKRGIIASYYTSVEYMDKNVGIVLDEVKAQGLEENTLIIYIGDQGYLLNDHKRFEKHMMWEQSVKAPFIVKVGKNIKPFKSDALVEFIDIAPTIFDLLGVETNSEVQGKSIAPVITKDTTEHKEYVFAEFLVDNKAMIASKEWKYIYTTGLRDLGQGYATGFGASGMVHRLYNLKNDPNELTDVSKNPENNELLEDLKERMIQIFIDTDPRAKSLPQNLSKDEMLTWFCVPPEKDADLNAK